MRYLRFTAIKAREYHNALHSLDFLGCLTKREFRKVYYDGSTALRGVRLPKVQSWLESQGLTPGLVQARTAAFLADRAEINAGRIRRGECIHCGEKKKRGVCPNCDEANG